MAGLFLVFKGISILFCTVSISIYIPINCASGFPFLHIVSSTVCRIFDNGSSDLCEVIRHWSFDLHFTDEEIKAQTSLLPTALVLLSEEARIWTWVSLNPKPAFFSTTYSDALLIFSFIWGWWPMVLPFAGCLEVIVHVLGLMSEVRWHTLGRAFITMVKSLSCEAEGPVCGSYPEAGPVGQSHWKAILQRKTIWNHWFQKGNHLEFLLPDVNKNMHGRPLIQGTQ